MPIYQAVLNNFTRLSFYFIVKIRFYFNGEKSMSNITHNEQAQRFEIQQDGQTAYLSYQQAGDKLIYDHTIVPDALGGQGIGKQLAKHALDYAREQGKKVVPTCSFVASYIQKNPQYQDLT